MLWRQEDESYRREDVPACHCRGASGFRLGMLGGTRLNPSAIFHLFHHAGYFILLASMRNPGLPVGRVVLGIVISHSELIPSVGCHDDYLSRTVYIRDECHAFPIRRPHGAQVIGSITGQPPLAGTVVLHDVNLPVPVSERNEGYVFAVGRPCRGQIGFRMLS